MKRALPLLLALVVIMLSACSAQHWSYEDLSITLPGDFQDLSGESYADGLDFLFDNGTVAIAGAREDLEDVAAHFGQLDAQEYAQLVISLNGLDCALTQKDGTWTFSYEAAVKDTALTYICAVYAGTDSFWQVQAYCASEDFSAQQEAMWEYILSAEVK